MNWDVFFDIFNPLPRQGPGTNASTRKAFEMLENLPNELNILDVGCGTGVHTVELARISNGRITAVDLYPQFLQSLKRNAEEAGFLDMIDITQGDMFNLEFQDNSFDLIWTEGAIYIMGFEKALLEWKRMLKPGGYLVASDATWFKGGAPKEIAEFWDQEYPTMTDVQTKLEMILKSGYELIGNFHLEEEAWFEFYGSLRKSIDDKRSKYENEEEAMETISLIEKEIDMYSKFKEYYGYEFYLMRLPKIETI